MGSVNGDPAQASTPSLPSDAPSAAEALLAARGLGRRVGEGPSATWIWRGVDLRLGPGELVTVRGATGAGKSLLLRALAQLDPVEEGELELLGRPASSWSSTAWRRRVSYLHQSPALLPGTVEDNLRVPFGWRAHRNRRYDRDRVLDRLRPLGRGRSWLDRSAEDLSGGERQIAALLRALLVEPAALLLDEPTAALDPRATATLERLVRSWLDDAPEGRRAVLWVTHDADQAGRVGGRRLVLEGGTLRPADRSAAAPEGAGGGG